MFPKKTVFHVFWLAVLAVWMVPSVAHAIPAFARANHVPCTTCHVQFAKLNDFGMAFKQNGYRMQGKKGHFVWTQDDLPIAALFQFAYETVDTGTARTGTAERRGLDLLSGGSLGPDVSFFFDYGFTTDTLTTAGADTVEVTTATPGGSFVIFSDILPDNLVNVRAGIMSNEFLHVASARRTTMADYQAPVSLENVGVEVNGVIKWGLRYAAGFGNDEMVGVSGVTNNLRGGYGWATYTLANQTVGARFVAAKAGAAATADETHTQWDLDADLRLGRAYFTLGYYAQDNVAGVRGDEQTTMLLEVVDPLTAKVMVTARYEAQDTKTGGASVPGTDRRIVFNTSLFVMPNVAMMAEFNTANKGEQPNREERFLLGFRVGI